MSYEYQIDSEQNCVFVRHFGVIDVGEVQCQLEETAKDPNFRKHMNLLRDVSQATLPEGYDFERFHRINQTIMQPLDRVLGIERRVAWVLGNVKDYGTIHQFSVSARLNRLIGDRKPFRQMEKALKWLGLPGDYEIFHLTNS